MLQRVKQVVRRFLLLAPGRRQVPERSDYKTTWQRLSATEDDAKHFVAGTADEAHFAVTGARTVDLLRGAVGITQADVVLEIGCGVGRVGKLLSPLCREWIGTDISSNMLAHARRRLDGLDNVRLVELSGAALTEIPSRSVDVVYCTVVFMHLYEWDRCRYVYDAHRVLRDGGRVFYDNVDIASPYGKRIVDDALAFDPLHRPAHMAMTSTGDELEAYARWAGFTDIEVKRWDQAWVGVTAVRRG